MAKKPAFVELKCGLVIEIRGTKSNETARLNILELYTGYSVDLKQLGSALIELSEMGYESDGIYRDVGYYDSTDDVWILLTKKY